MYDHVIYAQELFCLSCSSSMSKYVHCFELSSFFMIWWTRKIKDCLYSSMPVFFWLANCLIFHPSVKNNILKTLDMYSSNARRICKLLSQNTKSVNLKLTAAQSTRPAPILEPEVTNTGVSYIFITSTCIPLIFSKYIDFIENYCLYFFTFYRSSSIMSLENQFLERRFKQSIQQQRV